MKQTVEYWVVFVRDDRVGWALWKSNILPIGRRERELLRRNWGPGNYTIIKQAVSLPAIHPKVK